MKKLATIILLCMIAYTGKTQDKNAGPNYAPCCQSQEVTVTIDDKHRLFVPNSFIPGAKGKNGVFVPTYTGGAAPIQSIFIYSLEGDTILYKLYGRDEKGFIDKEFGWDGTRTGGEPLYSGDWQLHRGGFRYEINLLTEKEGYRLLKGIACALHCGDSIGDKTNCYFSSQVDNTGRLDPKVKVAELDCVK